ncbi:hypothetical protein [Phenylobacterium soli]|uniref:hypothetical protein n=1 Tax=Phenylobacterium soli TaxID=2170551 RepID=UPI003614E7D8
MISVDWATASFFERVIHGLWLDPDEVRAKFDVAEISTRHRALNSALVTTWRRIAPGSDAAVIEFDFSAVGNAKRKLLRRLELNGHMLKRRGGVRLRSSLSLKWLNDYSAAYEIVARQCGGELLGWCFVPSPLRE